MAYIFGSIWDRFNRNALNHMSKSVEQQGKSIQDLVAEGQLTPTQYANLIQTVNGLISKGEVTSSDIDKNNFYIDQTMLTDSLRSIITGNTPINAVPADNSISTSKYMDNSITIDKVANDLINGRVVKMNVNSIVNFDFEKREIELKNVRVLHGSKTYLIPLTTPTFIVPEALAGQQTLLISYNPLNSSIGVIEPRLMNQSRNDIIIGAINFFEKKVQGFENYSLGGLTTDKRFIGKRFNKAEVYKTPVNPNSRFIIDFKKKELVFALISIHHGNERVFVNAIGKEISFNDFLDNDTYLIVSELIRGVDNSSEISFIRERDVGNLKDDEFVIGAFNPITEEVYGMDNIEIIKTIEDSEGESVFDDKNEFALNIDKMTELTTIDNAQHVSNFKSADLYNLYDEFLSFEHVEKEVLATESSGLPINAYRLKPRRADVTNYGLEYDTERPHLLLVAGVHPAEQVGWYSLYNVINRILNNWKENDVLRALRWDVDITVVPMVNPWGLDNMSVSAGRNNANGIDLNRNYPVDFVVIDPSTAGYGGEEPLSEPETQAISNIIENEKVDLYADFHNFFSNPNENAFIWNLGNNKKNSNVAEKLITHISQKWKEELIDIPQDYDIFFGRISGAGPGSPVKYCATKGINASVFEVCQKAMFADNTNLSSTAMSLAVDAQTNFLYQMYRNTIN